MILLVVWSNKVKGVTDMDKWNLRFLDLAKHISNWSKDPSTKVGAVIVDEERKIISLGYNGFPRGVEDLVERLNDRPTKYAMVAHAELNAILSSNVSVKGTTVYVWPLPPCNECAKAIIQSGIKRVITLKVNNERWGSSNKTAKTMFEESGVAFIQIDIENC